MTVSETESSPVWVMVRTNPSGAVSATRAPVLPKEYLWRLFRGSRRDRSRPLVSYASRIESFASFTIVANRVVGSVLKTVCLPNGAVIPVGRALEARLIVTKLLSRSRTLVSLPALSYAKRLSTTPVNASMVRRWRPVESNAYSSSLLLEATNKS